MNVFLYILQLWKGAFCSGVFSYGGEVIIIGEKIFSCCGSCGCRGTVICLGGVFSRGDGGVVGGKYFTLGVVIRVGAFSCGGY